MQTCIHLNVAPCEYAPMHNKGGEPPRSVLEWLMREKGLSDNELARELQAGGSTIVQSTITRIRKGETISPDEDTLKAIARYFGVTTAVLRGEGGVPGQEHVVAEPLPAGKYVYPMAYEVVARKGRGRLNEGPHVELEGPEHSIPIPSALLEQRGWRVDRLAVAKTDGLSMKPTLGEDEPVVINLDETKIANGKIYAIEDSAEGLRIKRLTRQPDGRILVRSDNPDKFTYPDEYLTPESKARVVGRVVYRWGEL